MSKTTSLRIASLAFCPAEIVVADSGPLHYLILLDYTEPLRRFYGRVLVPDAVASERSSAGAPPIVRDWIEQRSAVALAATLGADLLLIDEAAGRAGARPGICA